MFPDVEVRHLRAVVALAEELNFTRAAHRLHITQSTLSRQITGIEEKCGFRLFTRDNRRTVRVELTDAGRVFVDGACSSLLNIEQAVRRARTAQDGGSDVLLIGYSPCVDEAWVSAILAVRLPSISQAPGSTVESVLNGAVSERADTRSEPCARDSTTTGS